jgi:hypothetical protein
MNPGYALISALLVFLTGVCFGQVELAGYMALREDSRFVLRESADGRTSEWIKLGSTFAGFKLLSYDHEKEVLTVERSGTRLDLPLKESRIQPAAPPGPQPRSAKFKLGTVRIKFVTQAPISEQAVRDIMLLRPGVEFDDKSLDRDVRALYRSGHFNTIEVKHEQAAPDMLNLEVIVTPKSQ